MEPGAGRARHPRAPRHAPRADGDRARRAGRAVGRVAGPRRPSLARLLGCLAYQQTLLGDARRNRAFHRALAARVRPGQTVLDLGAGTGVWAVAAARLGRPPRGRGRARGGARARHRGPRARERRRRPGRGRAGRRAPRAAPAGLRRGGERDGGQRGLRGGPRARLRARAHALPAARAARSCPEWVALAAAPVRAPVAARPEPRAPGGRRASPPSPPTSRATSTPRSSLPSPAGASCCGSTCARRAPSSPFPSPGPGSA